MAVEIDKVKQLITLLEESGIAELEIHEGDDSIRIQAYSSQAAPQAMPYIAPAPTIPSTPAATPSAPKGHEITSPMVGTFYASPAPDQLPFVEIGTPIKVGQTLCIIEAMKMLNPIEADRSGRIISVLGVNGQAVEFGETLFVIEPE
jgi:acetyl-CoA carboxylase biotin carboxyl carrier protein